MAGPTQKEMNAAKKILDLRDFLGSSRVRHVRDILSALGFSIEDTARLMRCSVPQAESMLSENSSFSGAVLSKIASEIRLKPGTLLGRQHFNASQTVVKNGESWIRPHRFFVSGDRVLGGKFAALVEGYYLQSLVASTQQDTDNFAAIVAGTYPCSISLLRKTVAEAERRKMRLSYSKTVSMALKKLKLCLSSVPKDVCTVDQVYLPPLSKPVDQTVWEEVTARYCTADVVQAENTANTPLSVSERGQTAKEVIMDYDNEFKTQEIGVTIYHFVQITKGQNVIPMLNGETMSDDQLKKMFVGDLVLSEQDLSNFLDKADDAHLGQNKFFLELDTFLTKVKQSRGKQVVSMSAVESVSSDNDTKLPDSLVFYRGNPEAKMLFGKIIEKLAELRDLRLNDINECVDRKAFINNLSGSGSGSVTIDDVSRIAKKLVIDPAFLLRETVPTDEEYWTALEAGLGSSNTSTVDSIQVSGVDTELSEGSQLIDMAAEVHTNQFDKSLDTFDGEETEVDSGEEETESEDAKVVIEEDLRDEMAAHLYNQIVDELSQDGQICLDLLYRLACGEEVDPDEVIPGRSEIKQAKEALAALQETYPELYKELVAELAGND